MSKFICSNKYFQHNWIPCEKDTDWDVCTECGAKRKFISEMSSGQYDEEGQSWVNEQRHLKPFENVGDNGGQIEQLNGKLNRDLLVKQFSKRQQKIIALLEAGYKQIEIAKKLGWSLRTVKTEIARIRSKIIILIRENK